MEASSDTTTSNASSDEEALRQCPYCREPAKAAAVRCPHCGSPLTPADPGHGGACPFCKEEIDPRATRCRHCRSDLKPAPTTLRLNVGGFGGGGIGGGFGGGFADRATCVERLQACYVDCSFRHPYDQDSENNFNRELREGCEDACDALYRACRGDVVVA